MWIEQFELSQGAQLTGCVQSLIKTLADRCPWTVAVYWQRGEGNRLRVIQFTRQQVLRYTRKGLIGTASEIGC